MDDALRTKNAILQRNRDAAARVDRAINALSDEQMLAVSPGGGWSPRDIVAHMGGDLRWFAEQLEALRDGREPSTIRAFGTEDLPTGGHDMSTQDGRNAAQHELLSTLSLNEVRQRWDDYRARVDELIRELPPDSLEVSHTIAPVGEPGQVRPAESGEQGWPLWRWIAGITWYHFEDHAGDLEAAANRG